MAFAGCEIWKVKNESEVSFEIEICTRIHAAKTEQQVTPSSKQINHHKSFLMNTVSKNYADQEKLRLHT